MTAFCVHQFPSSPNILFQSLIIAPLHAIFFSFFFFETVENVRHRKKRPAAHSTNTCRVFSFFPVCFPSDRAPSDNFVSARTRVGGMGECRGKSRRFSSIFFETCVTRFFPPGFFLFSPLFLLHILLQWKFCPCYSFVLRPAEKRRATILLAPISSCFSCLLSSSFSFEIFRGTNLNNKYSRMALKVAGAISVWLS